MSEVQSELKRLTVKEVAEIWGTTEQRVLHHIATGALRATNICTGNERPRWRITLEAVREFEARKSNKPPPAPAPRRKRKSRETAYF